MIDTIICGDNLEVMEEMDDESVDLVVTSPPYNFGGFSRNGRKSGYDIFSDNLGKDEYKGFIKYVLIELSRILKKGGAIYWNHKGKYSKSIYYHPYWVIELCDLQLYQDVIWQYPSSPDVAKVKWYPRKEHIFMFTKGKPSYFAENMASLGDVWYLNHSGGNKDHPAPFPKSIPIRCILASTCPEQIVFDPFMGIGTTALAAIETGRHYIGIDISPKYCEIARERIRIEKSQLKLPF